MSTEAAPEETGRKWGGRALLVGAAATAAVAVLAFFSHQGLYQSYRLRQERVRLEQENARLAEENARLARTIDRLQNDPEMIQDLIRRELNFIKKNETIIQLGPQTAGIGKDQPALPAAQGVKEQQGKGKAVPGPDAAPGSKAQAKKTGAPPRKKAPTKTD